MSDQYHYVIAAIPLNRPEIIPFLTNLEPSPIGAPLQIVGQRPTADAESKWIDQLAVCLSQNGGRRNQNQDLKVWLSIDTPRAQLRQSYTDRLVPVELLADPEYLTLNAGGWTCIYFGVVGLSQDTDDVNDPLMGEMRTLQVCGSIIPAHGADFDLVASRLDREAPDGLAAMMDGMVRVGALRQAVAQESTSPFALAERLYEELVSGRRMAAVETQPVPEGVLYDALMGALVVIEEARRAALFRNDAATADYLAEWQDKRKAETGLELILKAEYIVGRSRRSTVMIAPELGLVVKQPGPEPYHEIDLGAVTYNGAAENWPMLTHDGALVTSRGRMCLTVEENLLTRLSRVFGHGPIFNTLFGWQIEPFIDGPTLREYILGDTDRLTADIYDMVVLNQLVCEELEIENGDWHSANFMERRPGDWVHIDWGAARPLAPHEQTPDGREQRFNQVENLSFSFHDKALAKRTVAFHKALVNDEARLSALKMRAKEMAASIDLL